MNGAISITRCVDGRWALSVNGAKPTYHGSLDAAIVQAANVTFAPGESPGSWHVFIADP